jgi:predicted GNAT family acetyltransferase
MEFLLHLQPSSLALQTVVKRDWEYPELMSFVVLCQDEVGHTAASLEGFFLDLGYYPEPDELDAVFFLDGRSEHALEAFDVLAANQAAVEAMLPSTDVSAFIHLEEAKVSNAYRGKGLALRMMREARFVLRGFGRLATLKAHPLEGEANENTQLRLASYYQSDERLGFQAINATEHPGWLVAAWDEPAQTGRDGATWR